MSAAPDTDVVRRFVAEHQDVRGQFVRLGAAWLALREHGDYPPAVRTLLGEATCAAVLLASTLKFEGVLTLQLQGNGAVRLLVAQCTDDFRIRSVARYDAARLAGGFRELAGDGQVTVTVESGRNGSRYQGIVPLVGDSLAASLEHYFASSDQVPTAVRLAAEDAGATGMLVQRMPSLGGSAGADDAAAASARQREADATFDSAGTALSGIGADELLRRPAQELVQRCLAGVDARLHSAQAVRFECRCSPERVAGMLRSLGEAEVRDVLAEQGSVTVTCEFCHRPYRFDAVDVEQLFAAAGAFSPGSPRVN
ncbi:MAG: Hsp33 family molecular chaperone HslO [Steroidobacteraceae bacterium]|jgi:molecular chaperone Hsp33|nr:Hsp33 family molecular chaperone HslO [Steroidobacteraceae bacterium]